MATVYEATIRPASTGFGMWQRGEVLRVEGAECLEDWMLLAEEAGTEIEEVPAGELPYGVIYDENGGKLFRYPGADPEGGEYNYSLVYVEDDVQ